MTLRSLDPYAQHTALYCRYLDDFEDRLTEVTVDEMLEKYPVIAQEIKDEIEAGIWHQTEAGFKPNADALAVQATEGTVPH
jgi:hypothetical protein